MSKIAFVDETFMDAHGRTPGYYQLSAALVDGTSAATLRSETLRVAPRGGFHASALARAGREGDVEAMLQHVAASDCWNLVVVTVGHLGKSEPARQHCLGALLRLLDGQKITHVVADSREAIIGRDPQARNRIDLSTLRSLRAAGHVSRHMTM